jgi:hypothetical protein
MVKVPAGIETHSISGLLVLGLGDLGMVTVAFLGTMGPGAWEKTADQASNNDITIKHLVITF